MRVIAPAASCFLLAILVLLTPSLRADDAPMGGIGIALQREQGRLVIAKVLDGSPASKAGLHVGDILQTIDGQPADDSAPAHVRGPVGTDVKLGILRDGKTLELTCRRETLAPPANLADAPPPGLVAAPSAPPETGVGNAVIGIDKAQGPGWLKPGVRLTYSQCASLLPGGFDELVRDRNGRIVSRNTGERFDEIRQQGITAYTFLKLDIAAVRDNAIVLDDHAYTHPAPNTVFLAPIVSGEVVAPGRGGDTWIDPRILRQQQDSINDTVAIYHEDYRIADKTYHGIAFSVRDAKGWRYSVYDLDTGLLLHQATAGPGGGHLVRNGQVIEQGNNDTVLTQSTFVSMRQLQIPWADAHLPRAADADRFTYQGARVVSMSGVTTTIPVEVELAAHDRSRDIVPMKVTIGEYNFGPNAAPLTSSYERVAAPSELMPQFIDPAELDKLQQGQQIDRDPETGYVETVTYVGKSPHGRDIVTLTESAGPQNPSTQYIYDKANGIAIAVGISIPALHQQITVVMK